MRKLIINGIEAILSKDNAISLTESNVNITGTSTYSYELKLPINADNNLRIFGAQNMSCTTLSQKTYSATLIFDAYQILGEVKILGVEAGSLSVQFLAGNALVNSMKNTYIDEMDFGDITENLKLYKDILIYSYKKVGNELYRFNEIYKEHYVLCRSYDTKNGEYANVASKSGDLGYKDDYGTQIDDDYKFFAAPQPRLLWIMEEIFNKLGAPIVENFLSGTIWETLYIQNATMNNRIAKSLPHWTIPTFIEEFEKLFNCTVQTGKGQTKIISKNLYYTTTEVFTNVISSFTKKVSDDEESDIAYLSYNLVDNYSNSWDKLSEDIRTHSYKVINNSPETYFQNHSSERDTLYVENTNGMHFFDIKCEKTQQFTTLMLDCFRNVTHEEDDVELNIIPVTMGNIQTDFLGLYHPQSEASHLDTMRDEIPFLDAYYPTESRQNIQSLVDGDESTESETSDVMQIAFYQENDSKATNSSSPKPSRHYDQMYTVARRTPGNLTSGSLVLNKPTCTYVATTYNTYVYDSLSTLYNTDYPSLELYPRPDDVAPSIGNFHSVTSEKILYDSTIEITFKFISTRVPILNHVFLIDNKKYVCKEVSMTISEDGLNPLMEGTFYRVIN